MKRLYCMTLAMIVSLFSLAAGNKIAKSPEYGKYDASFDKVFEDISNVKSTDELHSLVVLKGGKLIYDRHDPVHSMTSPHILWSASKSFTSIALGFAIQDGLLSLDDKVVSFFSKEELPETISPRLAKMTVRDLATMSSGFEKDLIGQTRNHTSKESARETLAMNITFEPGTLYNYNSMNTYLIGVIVSRLAGKDLDEYLGAKLFKPLGIKDWYWEKSAEGYCCGGWGLFLSPESLAKVGQFMLDEGRWKGRQLLDPGYIKDATSAHILQYTERSLKPAQKQNLPNDDWRQGYGYQFWRCTHNAYRMSGAHNQWVIVVPDKDAVIVVTSFCSAGQKLMDSIWANIWSQL